MKLKNLSLLTAVILTLAGCESMEEMYGAQYWQRTHTSEAVYQQGPKSQQMLNRDIGRCVVELRELEGLHMVTDPLPMNSGGRILDPDEKGARKGSGKKKAPPAASLLGEQGQYKDFEGCMLAKGWERTQYLPYVTEEIDNVNAYKNSKKYGYDPVPLQYRDKNAKESDAAGYNN